MKRLRASRVVRVLTLLVAGFIMPFTALMAGTTPAHAAPAVVPAATGFIPVSSHCGQQREWVSDLSSQDKYIKLRIWHYTSSDQARNFCVKLYKVHPKGNKTKISLDVEAYTGKVYNASTKKSSLWALVKAPQGYSAYVRPHYGKRTYQWLQLHGIGA